MRSTMQSYAKPSRGTSPNRQPRLPWPVSQSPARIPVCESSLAAYSIGICLEQWAKDDPRGMLVLRAERHARGRSFPSLLLLWRLPLGGLTQTRAEGAFAELTAWLRDRAQTDAIREEARL